MSSDEGKPVRLRIQCGGSVDIDGVPAGRADTDIYDELACSVPEGLGFEQGDSLTFEMRLVQFKNTPVPPG